MSTQFRSTELQAKKRELRDMALEAARDKARQSAAALEVELGSVISIEEIGRSDRANWGMEGNVFANEYRSASAAEGDALIPGAVPLSLTVEVEYAIAGGAG